MSTIDETGGVGLPSTKLREEFSQEVCREPAHVPLREPMVFPVA
jgi:hypothetical protein